MMTRCSLLVDVHVYTFINAKSVSLHIVIFYSWQSRANQADNSKVGSHFLFVSMYFNLLNAFKEPMIAWRTNECFFLVDSVSMYKRRLHSLMLHLFRLKTLDESNRFRLSNSIYICVDKLCSTQSWICKRIGTYHNTYNVG